MSSASATPALRLDATDLTCALQDAVAAPGYRPPTLPSVAMELMRLAWSPDVQFGAIVKVLEKDPLLAARVLSIAQSALYTTRSPVVSLQQAALRLGLKTLGEVVLEAGLKLRVFRARGHDRFMERLQRHCTAAAHVTRAVCRRASVDGEHAFVSGLLHDMGYAACVQLVSEHPQWSRLPFDTLAPALDAAHADVSGLLARAWALPEPIRQAIATHHQPVVDGEPRPMNAALIVAEQLCWEAGAGLIAPPPDPDPEATVTPEPPMDGLDVNWPDTLDDARRVLALDEEALLAARREAFQLVAKLGADGREG
jgi:putative nucleotidyltransferase with HDIG domain